MVSTGAAISSHASYAGVLFQAPWLSLSTTCPFAYLRPKGETLKLQIFLAFGRAHFLLGLSQLGQAHSG